MHLSAVSTLENKSPDLSAWTHRDARYRRLWNDTFRPSRDFSLSASFDSDCWVVPCSRRQTTVRFPNGDDRSFYECVIAQSLEVVFLCGGRFASERRENVRSLRFRFLKWRNPKRGTHEPHCLLTRLITIFQRFVMRQNRAMDWNRLLGNIPHGFGALRRHGDEHTFRVRGILIFEKFCGSRRSWKGSKIENLLDFMVG